MKLTRAPQGLLELLGLKTLGEQPSNFDDAIKGVVESTDFYASPVTYTLAQTFTATGIGGSVNAANVGTGVQPAGPVRYKGLCGGVTLGAAAGTYLQLRLGIRHNPTASTFFVGEKYITAGLVAAKQYVVVASQGFPCVLAPGWQLVIEVVGDAAGADHVPFLRTFEQLLTQT